MSIINDIDARTWHQYPTNPTYRGADPFNAGSGSCPTTYTEGEHFAAAPTFAKPAVDAQFNDPTYGTCVRRLTDHVAEGTTYVRNDYARRDPVNADGSLFFTYVSGGWWRIFDYATLTALPAVPNFIGDSEPHWHPTNPDIVYHLPNNGGLVMYSYTVSTDATATVADFTNVASVVGGTTSILDVFPTAGRVWTRSEGSPSMDGRYWAFMVEDAGFNTLGLITYDLVANAIIGVYDFATHGITVRPNNVSMSPTGNYVVCQWFTSLECALYDSGSFASPCGIMAYNQTLTSGYSVSHRAEHSDVGLGPTGNDVLVVSNYTTGYLELVDIATKVVTNLFYMYAGGGKTSMHISCKCFGVPGWVLISTYASTVPDGGWFDDKLLLIELTASPRILNVAHTQNVYDPLYDQRYFSEVHGCISRDGTKIFYNCNWNTGIEDMDVYEIELPVGVFT